MREIKFRVWDGKSMSTLIGLSYGEIWTDCNHPIQQFTGLKDKNEVEIYEGDIVRSYNCKQPLKVIFRNACFCVEGEKGGISDIYDLAPVSSQALEVIGNIHENPELLD